MATDKSPKPQKKIVSAGPAPAENTWPVQSGSLAGTPEGKKRALTLRLISFGLWAVAIAVEAFTIFWIIKHPELHNFMVWLIAAIVVIAAFAITGSVIWKRSNRLNPASREDKIQFFVQNQLGAIIGIVAFLPLIIVIFSNKNMDQQQKTIAGVVGIIVLLIVEASSIDYAPVSAEQVDEDAALVIAYTGQNQVYWVKGGSVYHLCAEYPAGTTISPLARGDVNTNPVYSGTVAQAVDAGMKRLSMYGFTECGYTEGQPQYGTLAPVNPPSTVLPTATPS